MELWTGKIWPACFAASAASPPTKALKSPGSSAPGWPPPHPRRPAPRPQAGQRHDRRPRAGPHHRLWTGGPCRTGRSTRDSRRHAALHGPGATGGAGRLRKKRHLLAGPGALRTLHRQTGLHGRRVCRVMPSCIRNADSPTPSSIAPDIEPKVERIILACLRKDPAARPASALLVARACREGIFWPPPWPRAKHRRRKWSPRPVKAGMCATGRSSRRSYVLWPFSCWTPCWKPAPPHRSLLRFKNHRKCSPKRPAKWWSTRDISPVH